MLSAVVVLSVPFIGSMRIEIANPARHNRRKERQPETIGEIDAANGEAPEHVEGIRRVVCLNLIGCIAANKVEESKTATWMSVQPGVGNTKELVVEDDEVLTCQDAGRDVLAREHGQGERRGYVMSQG